MRSYCKKSFTFSLCVRFNIAEILANKICVLYGFVIKSSAPRFILISSTVIYKDQIIELSKNEMRILYTLLQHKESIVSRDQLMESLWQSNEFIDDNTLTVNVNRVRKKLEAAGLKDFIKTKRGQGYMI